MDQSITNLTNQLINQGARAKDIDAQYKLYGYATKYNPLLYKPNWEALPANLYANAKMMGRDFTTATGKILDKARNEVQRIAAAPSAKAAVMDAFVRAAKSPRARKVIKDTAIGASIGSALEGLGAIPGAIAGAQVGLLGGPKQFLNVSLTPYHTSVGELVRGKTDPRDVIQGIMQNPLTASIDIASLGGAKAIKSRFTPNETPEKLFNNRITDTLGASRAKFNKEYRQLNVLESTPTDNEKIGHYIMTNETDGLGRRDRLIGRGVRLASNRASQVAIKNGWIDPAEHKANVIAQYVMQKNAVKNPSLYHDQIVQHVLGEPTITDPKMLEDINKGEDLFNHGKIAYLSQALVPSTDPMGRALSKEINPPTGNWYDFKRVIGRSMASDIAPRLEDTVRYQLDNIYNLEQSKEVTKQLLDEGGRKITKGEKLNPNEVIVNPKHIDELMKRSYLGGNTSEVYKQIKNLADKGDEGIAIDSKYLNAIANAARPAHRTLFSRFNNILKKNLLATPHWFGLNRIGNISNNILEGIQLQDYRDALGKYRGDIPQQLKEASSFNSYINTGLGASLGPDISKFDKTGLVKGPFVQGIKKVTQGFKTKDFTKALEGINDIGANNIFKAEATFETADRWANLIRQAKRYAKENNLKEEDVIKSLSTDKDLYNKLNLRTNQTLGDYVGRNYFVDPKVYDYSNALFNFWKFPAQTARTTFNQLADRGLAFQTMAQMPSKYGRHLSNQIINQYGLDPTKFTGGVPYYANDKDTRTMGFEPLPAWETTSELASILSGEDPNQVLNPIFTMAGDVSRFQKMGRTAKTPRETELKMQGKSSRDFEPTASERLGYLANMMLGYSLYPYRVSTTYGPELYSAVLRQPLQSRYDTFPNIYTAVPTSYARKTPMELLGKNIGIDTMSQLKAFKQRPNPSKDAIRRMHFMQDLMKRQQQIGE